MNQDDSNSEYWRSLLRGQSCLSFGLTKNAAVTADQITYYPSYSTVELKIESVSLPSRLPAPGKHMVQNALAVAVAA